MWLKFLKINFYWSYFAKTKRLYGQGFGLIIKIMWLDFSQMYFGIHASVLKTVKSLIFLSLPTNNVNKNNLLFWQNSRKSVRDYNTENCGKIKQNNYTKRHWFEYICNMFSINRSARDFIYKTTYFIINLLFVRNSCT